MKSDLKRRKSALGLCSQLCDCWTWSSCVYDGVQLGSWSRHGVILAYDQSCCMARQLPTGPDPRAKCCGVQAPSCCSVACRGHVVLIVGNMSLVRVRDQIRPVGSSKVAIFSFNSGILIRVSLVGVLCKAERGFVAEQP